MSVRTVYLFHVAAITNYHKPDGLTTEMYSLTVPEARSSILDSLDQNQGVGRATLTPSGGSGENSFLASSAVGGRISPTSASTFTSPPLLLCVSSLCLSPIKALYEYRAHLDSPTSRSFT